jgi:biofilm PGA synthesis N-glycosyltransferase PgaC
VQIGWIQVFGARATPDMNFPVIVAVTPARNEVANLRKLCNTMETQSLRPALWMIIDDGSADSTSDWAREYANSHPWVRVRVRADRGRYYRGAGVAQAFLFGVAEVNNLRPDWSLLAKVDADTMLPQEFFKEISRKFNVNPRLGIASGINSGESGVSDHPRGNNRVYRRQCWESIGGLPVISGWDTWDIVMARSKGWETAAFNDLLVTHLRPQMRSLRYSYHQGRISRFLGYTWIFAMWSSLRMFYERNPLCALAYFLGYLREKHLVSDARFISLLRSEQSSRLGARLRMRARKRNRLIGAVLASLT